MARRSGFRLGAVAIPVYLPAGLFSLGLGAVMPVVPALALAHGGDLGTAAVLSAVPSIGTLLGDLPAGAAVQRLGERRTMVAAALLGAAAAGLALLAPGIWLLAAGLLLLGVAQSVFGLARHAFLTGFVPRSHRARALSTLGGVFRSGTATGPFLGAAIIALSGSPRLVLLVPIAVCLAAVVFLLRVPELPDAAQGRGRQGERNVLRALAANRAVLLKLGAASAILASLRTSRVVILPLWAAALGVDAATTSLLIGIAAALDLALFSTGGWIMDRFGRLWVAVPATLALAIAHVLIVLLDGWRPASLPLLTVALAMALANGIGSGVLMTIGADAAPRRAPAPFLAGWNLLNNIGHAAAPLWIAGLAAWLSVGAAGLASGGLGLLGAVLFWRFIPRFLPDRAQGDPDAPTAPIAVIVPEPEAGFRPESGLTRRRTEH